MCFHYTTPQNEKEIVGEPGLEPEPFSPKEKRRSKSVNNLLYDSEENFSSITRMLTNYTISLFLEEVAGRAGLEPTARP